VAQLADRHGALAAWFIALDLLLAYLPMAGLGRRLARRT